MRFLKFCTKTLLPCFDWAELMHWCVFCIFFGRWFIAPCRRNNSSSTRGSKKVRYSCRLYSGTHDCQSQKILTPAHEIAKDFWLNTTLPTLSWYFALLLRYPSSSPLIFECQNNLKPKQVHISHCSVDKALVSAADAETSPATPWERV